MGKIWFAGSGPFAAQCLEIISQQIQPDIIITAPPRKAGRGLKLKPTPVEEKSMSLGLAVHHTAGMSDDPVLLQKLSDDPPLTILVIDFGQIIKAPFLDFSELGCLNIHPSLLPQYRGAAPVQRAILDGKTETGVTVFRLVKEMDSGPVLGQEAFAINDDINSGEVLSHLAKRGSMILLDIINSYIPENISLFPQDHSQATFAPKIAKEEARIDVSMDALTFHNTVRAMNPHPGAFLNVRGKRLKVWKTERLPLEGEPGTIIEIIEGKPVLALSKGSVLLLTVQPEGKARMDSSSWARGIRLSKGDMIQ
jgi:methionyl-tRNA formyltransferase